MRIYEIEVKYVALFLVIVIDSTHRLEYCAPVTCVPKEPEILAFLSHKLSTKPEPRYKTDLRLSVYTCAYVSRDTLRREGGGSRALCGSLTYLYGKKYQGVAHPRS